MTAPPTTLLDALVAKIVAACETYIPQDEVPALALLWPDAKAEWSPVLRMLRQRLPILTLGPYDPETLTGPALFIRAALSGQLPGLALREGLPVIYLPGHGIGDLRAIDEIAPELAPLVYLRYRGNVLLHSNNKDLTPLAFLQSKEGGLGLPTAGNIQEALSETLPTLLEQRLADVQALDGGISSAWLYSLLVNDLPGRLLKWINDPESVAPGDGWGVFCKMVKQSYGVDPASDGPTVAARHLGDQLSNEWRAVWTRYREAPHNYPSIPARLRAAKPAATLAMFATGEQTWPQDNEAAEATLRSALLALAGLSAAHARAVIGKLETEHAPRRDSVWAQLAQTPLANALQQLALLARRTASPIGGATIAQLIAAYREWGWQADSAALDAQAAVRDQPDRTAVETAIRAIYLDWLTASAEHFQGVIGTALTPSPSPASREGSTSRSVPSPDTQRVPGEGGALAPGEGSTCLLFADGLRYDLGARLAAMLEREGQTVSLDAGFCALPGVTPTAKPACSPVAHLLGPGNDYGVRVLETGAALNQSVFVKLLEASGWSVLEKSAVLPSPEAGEGPGPRVGVRADARGWTEFGEFDSYGHGHGLMLAREIEPQLRNLAERVRALLAAGWARVVVVTDHGWLLMPGELPKTELGIYLAEDRKGRCARLKPDATVDIQSVPWHWDPQVRMAMAPGVSCFSAGKVYEHGGLSLQECVVPIVTIGSGAPTGQPVTIAGIEWRGMRCHVTLAGSAAGYAIDIRLKASLATSSIVEKTGKVDNEGRARVVVSDFKYEEVDAYVVVFDPSGNEIASQATTVGDEG